MSAEEQKISCSIFQKHEPAIKNLTDRINKAGNPGEKIRHAEKLCREAKALLDCREYKKGNAECEGCRTIAGLRKQTAELIIKIKKLI